MTSTSPRPPPLVRLYRDTTTGQESGDLLAFGGRGRRLDAGGVSDLLAFGYLAGRRTLLRGVVGVVTPWSLDPPEIPPSSLSVEARADRLWELLVAAVARAVEGTTAPRTTISGGLDSRAIAAALAAVAPSGASAGTFGDADCDDLPVAARVSGSLGLPHVVATLERDSALVHEERVWRATGGTGGPAAAPGAPTDEAWAGSCDVLLSGMSGDVIWGRSQRAGPSPKRRLERVGARYEAPTWDEEIPPAPTWLSGPGRGAWINLCTRQAGGTWNGILPRLPYTLTCPVLWDPALLAFCLALDEDDRRERSLVCRMLDRHASEVSTRAIPLSGRGAVHDLDRAFREPAGVAELGRWASDEASLQAVGLRAGGVARLVRDAASGRRRRAGFISRARALTRWAALLG